MRSATLTSLICVLLASCADESARPEDSSDEAVGVGGAWQAVPERAGAAGAEATTAGEAGASPGDGSAGSGDGGSAGAESSEAGSTGSEATPPHVVINEVACEGETEWVEVLNLGAFEIDASRLSVSDLEAEPSRRARGRGTLAPGGFLTIALERALECDEESAFLFHDGVLMDEAPARRPPPSGSWGRLPDGDGGFAETLGTPGASNRAFEDERTPFFDDPSLLVLELAVPEVSDLVLAGQRVETGSPPYVEAELRTRNADGERSEPLRIGIRLKGNHATFRGWRSGGKSAFKLAFDELAPGTSFAGMRRLTLNAMIQDPSQVHEWLAYRIFRSAGVPAPRTRHVLLEVNGEPWGTYVALEGFDDGFWQLNMDSTLAVYEGEYGEDVGVTSPGVFDLDEGSSREPLLAFDAAVLSAPIGAGFQEALRASVDWEEVLRCMAVETVIGHHDGYAHFRNNYFLHVDEAGVFRLLPWGTDRAFGEGLSEDLPLDGGLGVLLARCVEDPPCRAAYREELGAMALAIRRLDLGPSTRELGSSMYELALGDPRLETSPEAVLDGVERTVAFLDASIERVIDEVYCSDEDEEEEEEEEEEEDGEEEASDVPDDCAERESGTRHAR